MRAGLGFSNDAPLRSHCIQPALSARKTGVRARAGVSERHHSGFHIHAASNQSSFSRRIAHRFASNRAYFSVCHLSYRCATGCDVARAIAARSARFDTGFQDDARTTEPHDCAARAAADGAHVRCARAEDVRLRHDCEELERRRRHRDRRGCVLQARGGQGRRADAHAHYH